MAYKIASKKAQATARRIVPKRLGDFPVEEMSDEEKFEIAKRRKEATQARLDALPKTAETKAERKFLGHEIAEINRDMGIFKKAINEKRAGQQVCWNEYLIQSAKELLGPERWKEALKMADEKALTRGFRRKKP